MPEATLNQKTLQAIAATIASVSVIGSAVVWGYKATISHITEVTNEETEAMVEELEERLPAIIRREARSYHDVDMARRDLQARIRTLETALEKASEENRDSIAALIDALKAELAELNG